jgi:DNA polymerase-3 subunit delta
VAPVALLHGADAQLLDDALAAVERALFATPADAVFDRELLDARDATVEQLVSAAQTLPVQARARLVAVRHAQALPAKGAEALTAYAADPNPAARLLLLADESLTAARDRKPHWLLAALPAAAVVELGVRRGRQLEEWVRHRAAAEGLAVSEEAARLLVQFVGDDSALLLGEVRKAAVAGGPENRSVGAREVSAVVGEHRVSGVFDLTRAIERQDRALALRTLERLLETEEPLLLLAMLTREARTAWSIREWRARGQSVEQIARILRRPPPAIDAVVAQYGDVPTAVLADRLRRCWQVERRLKSGGDARGEMAVLVAELCGAR